jgi:II/X family phage/plasmid replication protein
MIDWFRGELLFEHAPLPTGRVLSISPDGEVEWESLKALHCRSSFETSLKIRSHNVIERPEGYGEWNDAKPLEPLPYKEHQMGMANSIMIDGNLAKFLQGHNVFGIRDLNRLLFLAFSKIGQIIPELSANQLEFRRAQVRILKGDYAIKMLDINQLYDCGSDANVEAFLHAVEMRARTRSGRSSRDKGTAYVNKTSRRWAFKFYNKLREMMAGKGHKLPEDLLGMGLHEFVSGKVRAELRLCSLELKERGITKGAHLTEAVLAELFTEYLGKITMTDNATLIGKELEEVSRYLHSSYLLWQQGANLRELLPRNTFYRHRKELLEHGIDISVPPVITPEKSNVIPLIRIIEAKPVDIPQWAYDKKLVAY